jgi:vacuolar-type H+-ATPase subunit H
MAQVSDVVSILNKLIKLEEEIDKITASVEDVKKRLLLLADDEINILREKVNSIAKAEAEKIIEKAKREAEAETNKINIEAERKIVLIESNIKKEFEKAVDLTIKRLLSI